MNAGTHHSYPRAERYGDGTPQVRGELIQVQVRDLREGDVCGGSGMTILKHFGRQPGSRHCTVRVRYSNGQEGVRRWGAYTKIRIVRPS